MSYGFENDNYTRHEIEFAWQWLMDSSGKTQEEWDGLIKGLVLMNFNCSNELRPSAMAVLQEANTRRQLLFGSKL